MKKYIFGILVLGFVLLSFTVNLTISYESAENSPTQQIDKGKAIFTTTCIACHQANGQGIPNVFPPLTKSDYLNQDVNRAIRQVIKGSTGAMKVNGKVFNGTMPPQNLTDQQVADVLTYIYNSWGNNKSKVTPAMVKAQRNYKAKK